MATKQPFRANANITTSFALPVGATTQRENSPVDGGTRINRDIGEIEFYLNGSWRPSGDNSFVLVSKFIPSGIWNSIVAGTNTVNVAPYIQNALDDCKTTHKTLIFPPYTYKCDTGIQIDYGSFSLFGYGSKLDFGNLAANSVAVTVSTPNNFYPLWDSPTYQIQGLNIKGQNYGPNPTTGTVGVAFGAGISNSGAHASFQNCAVSGFDWGMSWSDHSYIQKIDSCSIHYCNVGLRYAGATLQDSGERIGITNTVIFNSKILVWATAGDFTFNNCSFDYFTSQAIISDQGSSVHLEGCHIESQNNPNLLPWLVAKDSHSRICLANTRIVINQSVGVYIGIADESSDGESDVGSADAGIFLVNSFISFTPSGDFTLPTMFKGAVYITNLTSFDGGRYSSTNKRVHVYVDRNNLLQDYSFERLTNVNSEWWVNTASGYVNPTITTAQAATGTKSLSIAPAAGQLVNFKKSFRVGPGAKPTLSFKIMGTTQGTDYLQVSAYYSGSSGYDSLIASRTFIQKYDNTNINPSAWVIEAIRPYSRAPKGSTKFTVEFLTSATTTGMQIYIDDVMVEIIDNHPGILDLTDASINDLGDVDTKSTLPTNGQALVYNSTSGQWTPGTVAATGGTQAANNEVITGSWSFNGNPTKIGQMQISGYDFADKYTTVDSGVTFNYASSTSTTTPFPYFRDFTVFNGKGLAAMKIYGSTRTALFYSKLQYGMFTAGNNTIDMTGPAAGTGGTDPGNTGEIAINYNSGYDSTTGVYSQPYFRNFTVFNGKGGAYFKVEGSTYSAYINLTNFFVMDMVKFRGPTGGTVTTNLVSSHTANRTLTMPDETGTLATQAYVGTAITNASGVSTVPLAFKTASYAMVNTDYIIIGNMADSLQTITLPTAAGNSGRIFRISNGSSTTSITVTAAGGLVQWLASRTMVPSTQWQFASDGSNWFFV